MDTANEHLLISAHWIGLCSVLRPPQHSIGYMGDSFYRSKDPTNSIKVLKENLQKTNQTTAHLLSNLPNETIFIWLQLYTGSE